MAIRTCRVCSRSDNEVRIEGNRRICGSCRNSRDRATAKARLGKDEYYSRLRIYNRKRWKRRVANGYKQKPQTYVKQKDYQLRYHYGITLEDYKAILERQKGCCAICERKANADGRALYVDHDHETGVVRGLLCYHCNAGLGMLQDDPALLSRAIAHLKG